jgi:flavin reductase (DIM6/NTAB) family NADH-FMN oxidoreductase RutF
MMNIVDPDDLDQDAAYKVLIGTVLPRPIAWVSTLSTEGIANLAPISFFTVISRKPPRLTLTMQPRAGGERRKDTYTNILETRELVVHLATLPFAEHIHRSAKDFSPDQDEFEVLGLTKEPSASVAPPRIAGAPIAMECELDQVHPAGDLGGVVWVRVKRFCFADGVLLPNGRVDTSRLGVVGRLAAEYTLVSNAFVPPIGADVPRHLTRLDSHEAEYSPVESASWSPSGAVGDNRREGPR